MLSPAPKAPGVQDDVFTNAKMLGSLSYPCVYTGSAAFTLIELLIVISIISLVTGAMIPGFSSYIDNQNVRQAQEQVKSDLRTAQNKALTGYQGGGATVGYWGVDFTTGADDYDYFYADDTSSCGTTDRTGTKLPGDVVVRNAPDCVFFDSDNGDAFVVGGGPCNPCRVYLGASDASSCEAVEVNSAGLITKVVVPDCGT